MFDAAICAGMALGPPQVDLSAIRELNRLVGKGANIAQSTVDHGVGGEKRDEAARNEGPVTGRQMRARFEPDMLVGLPAADGRRPRKEYAVQVALYAFILGATGVGCADEAFVIGRDGQLVEYDLTTVWNRAGESLIDITAKLVDHARAIRDQTAPTTGAMSAICKMCHWHHLCERELVAADDLTMIAGVGRSIRDLLAVAQPGAKRGTTISGGTVSRELSALRAALRHAWKNGVIVNAPFIHDVDETNKAKPRELVYTPEQVARLLEAAARLEERRHVHLFIMIMLSTHGRVDAVLELQAATQIKDDLIYFLAPGHTQTRKRRSIVPIAPTLRPWVSCLDGKVIQYRTRMIDPVTGAETVVSRPTSWIKTAFAACLVEAGICEQEVDKNGEPVWLPPRRKLGETLRRPKMLAIGNPNTLRHTISTELHTLGVPEAQIDTAAGHAGEGTNKPNYRHLRPEYLQEFVVGVETYWSKVGKFTNAHIHPSARSDGTRLSSRA